MAEVFDSATAGFWLPHEFLDDDFFSDEKAAVAAAAAAARSDSDEEEPLGGLSRRMAGLDCDGTIAPKVRSFSVRDLHAFLFPLFAFGTI
jgi:hypothetical protein